jgi:hypothetical protein
VPGRVFFADLPVHRGAVRPNEGELPGQQFLLGDIHCAAEKPLQELVFNNGNTNAADVAYFAVRSNNSLFHAAAAAFSMHSSYGPSHEVPLAGERWLDTDRLSALPSADPGRKPEIARGTVVKNPCRVQCPTSHVCEALPFAEIKLASLQGLLGAFALRHVGLCNENLDKFPACGEHRLADCFEVFDRSIGQ